MAKPRILEPNALYHLGSRGSSRQTIVWDDVDRAAWLRRLDIVAPKFGWRVLAWCLMRNHFHLVVRDPDCTLSAGMRELNGTFSRRTNARHGRDAHLFRNRFWSKRIDTDEYLLGALRYNDLNPVVEGLCETADAWLWGSHQQVVGVRDAPDWLAVDDVLRLFARNRSDAIRRYRAFVGRDWRDETWPPVRPR